MNAHTLKLAPLAALAALLAAAILALAPARAEPPPEGTQLLIRLTDDIDNVLKPDQQFTVEADLRFPGDTLPNAYLPGASLAIDEGGRIQLSSGLDWDNLGGSSRNPLTPGAPGLIPGGIYPVWPLDSDNFVDATRSRFRVQAWDGRTAVGRVARDGNVRSTLYIIDTEQNRVAQRILCPGSRTSGPSAAPDHRSPNAYCPQAGGFGSTFDLHNASSATMGVHGTAMAVWHETDDIAWLFVGSPSDRFTHPEESTSMCTYPFRGGCRFVGSLWVYKLDWTTAPPTVTQEARIRPTFHEAGNRHGGWSANDGFRAAYGSAVSVSADGSTLAVGAPRMNMTGAVYIYTRPDGPGQDWGDIAYDDGVKVTPVEIPSLGNGTGELPFTPGAADGDAVTQCNAYCSDVTAAAESWFGHSSIALSEDGSVMVVGAPHQRSSFSAPRATPQWNAGGVDRSGQAFIFVEPDDGWDSVPDATLDAQGNAKTILPVRRNGNNARTAGYTRATHVSPGPKKRITEPTAVLAQNTWGSWTALWEFGQTVHISADGLSVLVGTAGVGSNAGRLYIYEQDSIADWSPPSAATNGRDHNVSADSVLTGFTWDGFANGAPGWGGFALSADKNTIWVGNPDDAGGLNSDLDWGRVHVLTRPETGWPAAPVRHHNIVQTAVLREPTPYKPRSYGPGRSRGFGYILASLDRERLVIGALGSRPGSGYNTVAQTPSTAGDGPGAAYFSHGACRSETTEDGRLNVCPISLTNNTVTLIPSGIDTAVISGSLTVVNAGDNENARTYTAELPIEIGTIKEVESVDLAFAVEDDKGTLDTSDDVPWPSSINRGDSTRLRLKVLSERGKASGKGSISTIFVTTTNGRVSGELVKANGAAEQLCGAGGSTCQIAGALLTQDRDAENVFLTLRHDGTSGPAEVTARAIAQTGEQREAALTVNLTGPPAVLTIARPTTGVLGYGTPDPAADVDAADVDNRDQLKLSVTAADAGGLSVPVPSIAPFDLVGSTGLNVRGPLGPLAYRWWRTADGVMFIDWPVERDGPGVSIPEPASGFTGAFGQNPRVRVTDPGGRQVFVNWYMRADGDGGNVEVVLDVDQERDKALDIGEYTLEVRAGSLVGEQTFTVTGGATTVALSDPTPEPALRSQFTITATVTDAEGTAVPNGTRVHWADLTIGDETTTLVQIAQQTATTDGQATATYLAVSPGRATITVTADGQRAAAGGVSGGVANAVLVSIADPAAAAAAAAAAQPPNLADQLSSTTPGAPSSYLGQSPTTAADVLAALDGVTTIQLWQYNKWLRYGVADSQVIPGSYNFQIPPGAVLWLSP